MADLETEGWAEKSKQIEAERMKAAKAVAEEKPDKSSLAFLDPKATKVKGWSNDANVIVANAERMGNRAVVFAVCGMVLDIIGTVGGMVTSANNLGMGGLIISGLPSGIGLFGIGLAFLMAVITVGVELFYKLKNGRKMTMATWSAVAAIAVCVGYLWVKMFVLNR